MKKEEKDPAFLMYSQRWLEGTADMTPLERAIYIDLLVHQHQKGSLPLEFNRLALLGRVSEQDFMQAWEHLKSKFDQVNGRYINKTMESEVIKRKNRAKINRINGIFASLLKKSRLDYKIAFEIKRNFDCNDFLIYPDSELNQFLTNWYDLRLKSFINVNTNKDINISNSNTKGGAGENLKEIYQKFKEAILQNQLWCEEVCMKTRSKPDELPDMIDNFISHCILGGEIHDTENDFTRHFRNTCLYKLQIVKPTDLKPIEDRKDDFRQKVAAYSGQYAPEMLEAFFLHWSQVDEKTNLMACESGKAFEIPNKLKAWKGNDKQFKKNGHSKKITGDGIVEHGRNFWAKPDQPAS